MAKKKEEGEGKKKPIVPIVLLLAGLFVGKTFLGGGGAAASTAGATGATVTTVAEGPVVTMGSTTVNLADGHLLKIGIAMQLDAKSPKAAGGETKPDATDPTKGWAAAMNMAIAVFGDQTYAQLLAPGGRETARQLLAAKLKVQFPADIDDVFFYEFVMQ